MASDSEGQNVFPQDTEIALQYFRQRLQETISFLKDLGPVYFSLAQSSNQLNSNAFAHRGEIDDAVDRTVALGNILDTLIKQTKLLLAEYQAVLVVDQAIFAEQLGKNEF